MRTITIIALLTGALLANLQGQGASVAIPSGHDLDSDPHLVGWWKLNETTGKIVADSSPSKHPGSWQGASTLADQTAPGRVDQALQFNGGNHFIQVTGYKGVGGTQARTIAMWIKTKSTDGELMSWGADEFGKMWILGFIRGRVGVTPKGGYLYMKSDLHDDQWHHVAAVIEAAATPNLHDHVKLYKDGALAEIDDIGLLDLWPIDTEKVKDVRIGYRFKGQIDDVRLYDRALSEDEIKALKTASPSASTTNPKP